MKINAKFVYSFTNLRVFAGLSGFPEEPVCWFNWLAGWSPFSQQGFNNRVALTQLLQHPWKLLQYPTQGSQSQTSEKDGELSLA